MTVFMIHSFVLFAPFVPTALPMDPADFRIADQFRSAKLEATSLITSAAGDSGSVRTKGFPASEAILSAGSSGRAPRKGTPSLAASRSPPPLPKISWR